MEDVVSEAGAAKGTFYLYFASWEELLLALRERIFSRFDAMHPAPGGHVHGADWSALIDTLATGFVDFTLGLAGLHRAIFHGPVARAPAVESNGAIPRIATLIDAGIRAGAFAKVDAQPTAALIFAVLHEAVDAIEEGQDRERVIRAMLALLNRCLLAV